MVVVKFRDDYNFPVIFCNVGKMQPRKASLQVFPSSSASKGSTAHKWPQSPRFEECPVAADTPPATSYGPVTYCSGKWSSVQSAGTTAATATAATTAVRCCTQPDECKCAQGEYGSRCTLLGSFSFLMEKSVLPRILNVDQDYS